MKTSWWLNAASRLYPKAWRVRYGREFDGLLNEVEPRWTYIVDVLRGAVMMQMRTLSSNLKLVSAVAVAGAVVALGVSFLLPGRYVSSAVVQAGGGDDPQTLNRIQRAWQDVASRRSLAELIQRPKLDLYRAKRNREPLEDVIEGMKKLDLKIEILNLRGAFRVSFMYPDRYKAQAVVDALTQKVREASRAGWTATPANLPQAPAAPDRLTLLIWGLGMGLLTGVVASFIRWRARWTMKVVGCGLAGCLIAAALSWLVPNRYTSSATLRVLPAPNAKGETGYIQEAEMAAWLAKKERDIFSDESLYEIIQRPALDLYHGKREDQPIKTVVGLMRKDLNVEAPHSHSAFTLSFTYSDRFKTQAAVSALVSKIVDSEVVVIEADLMAYHPPRSGSYDCASKTGNLYAECITSYLGPIFPAEETLRRPRTAESIEVLDPASLPETPAGPNRELVAGIGLFAGLFLGAYALRRKPGLTLKPA